LLDPEAVELPDLRGTPDVLVFGAFDFWIFSSRVPSTDYKLTSHVGSLLDFVPF
jgi:hypothetical protein